MTFWVATFVVLFAFVWVFKSVLMPFVLGTAIAYFIEPDC